MDGELQFVYVVGMRYVGGRWFRFCKVGATANLRIRRQLYRAHNPFAEFVTAWACIEAATFEQAWEEFAGTTTWMARPPEPVVQWLRKRSLVMDAFELNSEQLRAQLNLQTSEA